ncbi:MAG: radical SAM/SPASM domain-containing protein [Candidatus Hodarchaeota archaeon]
MKTTEILRFFESRFLCQILKKTSMWSKPAQIWVEPTARCNLRCLICSRRYEGGKAVERAGFMSREIFMKIAPYFKTCRLVYLSGFGSSLLHPDFFWMLDKVKRSGSVNTKLISNGLLIGDGNADKLIEYGLDNLEISIDAIDPQIYNKIRGADINLLLNNLKNLRKAKQDANSLVPHLSIHFVAMKDNIAELPKIIDLAAEIGAELVGVGNLMVHTEALKGQNLFMHKDLGLRYFKIAIERAKNLGIELTLPNLNENKSRCYHLFESLFITWDGLVLSCDFEKHLLGDLKNNSIEEIWNGKTLKELRKRYLKLGLDRLCPNCSRWKNDGEALLNPDPDNHKKVARLSVNAHKSRNNK